MQSWVQALGSTIIVTAVAIRLGERRVVEALQAAGAVDPEHTTKLPQEHFVQKWMFRRLLNAGVVGETMDQTQYLKLAEYVAYRRRRRKRALAAVVVVAALALVMYFTAGCTKAVGDEVTRRDSAGVELVTIPATAIAAAPVWTVDTATELWAVGGGDDPTQDVDRMGSVNRLASGDVVVTLLQPGEVRLYPAGGGTPRTLARGGAGPGEFRLPSLVAVRGDTLVIWDYSHRKLTLLTTGGAVAREVSYASQSRSRLSSVAGILDDGRVVTTGLNWDALADVGSEGVRREQSVYLLAPDGLSADSLPGPPGMMLYKGVIREGGESFSSPTTYHLDGQTPVSAGGSGYSVALPETVEIREYDATGTLRRILRPEIERREVTPELKERYIARDSVHFTRTSPQFATDWVLSLREGRFVERLAAFERVHRGPDGERWFERSWLGFDPSKQFVIFDSTGMVRGSVTIPMSRTIGWIGSDAVLTTWLDEDGVRHLSLNPLHRTAQ